MNPSTRIQQLEQENAELRRQVEALSKRSPAEHNSFAAIFDQLPVPIVVYQPDGVAVAINRANEQLIDTDRAAIIGSHNIFHDPEALIQGYVRHFEAACNGRVARMNPTAYNTAKAELIGRATDRVFWSETTYFPIYDAAATLQLVGEINLDVSERVRAQQEERRLYELIAERDRRFRALFDNNGLPIGLISADGYLIECNAAFCNWLGYSAEELQGIRTGTHTHPDDVAEDRRLFGELVAGQINFYRIEKRYICKDGTIVYGRLSNSVVHNEAGQVEFVMRIIEDITPRHKVEVALRTNKALLHALIDELPLFIYAKDAEGRYLLVNRHFAEALNSTIEQLVGCRDSDLFQREDAAMFEALDAEVLASEQLLRREYTIVLNGETHNYETAKFPLRDEQGRLYAICGVSSEITERKRAEAERLAFERQLYETQKLESLGIMAGGIAHDFNNLLVAMLGHASLAMEELAPTVPAYHSLQQIELAARRAADLTRQMLAYAGKSQLTIQPVDLNQLVLETGRLLQSSVPRQVSLRYELAPHLPTFSGDPAQIRQVVMNLVINGAEAIGERAGEVRVRTALSQISPVASAAGGGETLSEGPYVVLEVTDSGPGIEPAMQTRMFEPFFTTKFTGRGLGLAVVLGMVRGHRGAIHVESTPGAGALFRVLLPAQLEPGAEHPPNLIMPNQAHFSGTVLVIDDETDVIAVVGRMLRRMGLQVLAANSGDDALELYRTHIQQIGAVLLDVTMPGMMGRDVYQELRVVNPQVRVLLMSGHSEQEAVQGFPAEGVYQFVPKPFTFPELAAAVQRVMR